MAQLQKREIADFYRDYVSDKVTDPDNKASYFVSRNRKSFPSSMELHSEEKEKTEIEVIGIPSGIGQAKQVCSILNELCKEDEMSAEEALRTAVILPDEVGRNRFYYPPLWQGVRDYLKNSEDLNVECTEFSFPNEIDPFHSRGVEEVRALLAEDKLDGLLTVGHMEAMTMQEWQHARDAGVAVVQVGFRNPKIAPLCSVQPDYEVIGRTMAELIFSHIPSFGSVVLCAGNPKWEQHARIVQGFEDYMQENGAQNRIYLDNSCCIGSEAQRNILNLLEKPDVAACCSVLSQGSVMLVQGLQQCGKAGKVFAVGSDVFEENLDALRSRILDNIVQKNPYAQGYLGIKALVEYLVQGKAPEQRTIYVGSEVVFRSNAVMYDRDNFRGLLL